MCRTTAPQSSSNVTAVCTALGAHGGVHGGGRGAGGGEANTSGAATDEHGDGDAALDIFIPEWCPQFGSASTCFLLKLLCAD